MSSKLVILAHPSKKSLSYSIAEYFSMIGEEILDLYKPEFKQDYLYFEDVLYQCHDEKRNMMQKKILKADEIILIFPIWWGSFPAVMKNFLDVNLSFGFAFSYTTENGIVPGLKGKKISILSTCNSPRERYDLMFRDYIRLHFEECCGMKLHNFHIFDNMRIIDSRKKNKILKLIQEKYG